MSRLALDALALWLIAAPMEAVADERDTWAALVSGSHVALVRHGNAPPGYGDPPGFKIDDCATQRNLDELGRAQARAVGEAFRQHGVQVDKILSSPLDRKSTRLNSSHVKISYAVFCLKKKKKNNKKKITKKKKKKKKKKNKKKKNK